MNTLRTVFLALFCLVPSFAIAGDLPANDAGKHQLVVVGMPDSTPAKWFDEVPELAAIKKASAYTVLNPTGGLFKERYQAILGTDFPIVAYLRPDGGVIYFADKYSMPSKAGLFGEMKAAYHLAKKAVPLNPRNDFLSDLGETYDDCVDGTCPSPLLDGPQREPLFPRLRKNPLDSTDQPFFNGWFSNSITSGVTLVFSAVALGFILLFAILMLGAMIVIVRWVVK